MIDLTALRENLLASARSYGQAPLLALPDGTTADLDRGYIPLLVNFSFEDKAANGLRRLRGQTEPEPAVYFSAIEMARDHPSLILAGETGSGKTTFGRHLAYLSAGEKVVSNSLPRNDAGTVHEERWDLENVLPVYVPVENGKSVGNLVDEAFPEADTVLSSNEWKHSNASFLVILDDVEVADVYSKTFLNDAQAFQAKYPRIRLLLLGEASVVKTWMLPAAFTRYDVLPLLKTQRRHAAKRLAGIDLDVNDVALGTAAANPAQFAMALNAADAGHDAEILTDRWLTKIAGNAEISSFLCACAFDALSGDLDDPTILPVKRVRQLLAARHLLSQPVSVAVEVFRKQPSVWEPVLVSLAARLAKAGDVARLVEALIEGDGEDALRGALLSAPLLHESEELRERIAVHLLKIVTEGALTIPERERAGRQLSIWGDTRNLDGLADIPGGCFTFGWNGHPNSSPTEPVTVGDFRIGLYPVTNGAYGLFAQETGRLWRSSDAAAEDRRNAPATDLTWRDACAYCDWLTTRWRKEARIGPDEIVRLPTEPEWERAARGDMPDTDVETITYPWGVGWIDDASNSEEAGFNNTCTVGLFPKGRSPYGCFDMAGQVWEWCTTLWGEEMATPSFSYPYRNDGRENLEASPTVRRILRGGCFSSNSLKACCTYRGSLEPDGFWRGNGFRIVVAKAE